MAFTEAAFASDFRIDVVIVDSALVQTANAARVIEEPSYFYSAYRSNSLGHMLRDNLPYIVSNLEDLTLQQYTYQIVLFPQVLDHVNFNKAMIHKYSKLVAPASIELEALAGTATNKYLLFRDVVIGSHLFQYNHLRKQIRGSRQPPRAESRTAMFAQFPGKNWRAQALFELVREVAYKNLGIGNSGDVGKHQSLKVIFGEKAHNDKRRINNIADMLPVLQSRFKDFKIESKKLCESSPQMQLSILSTTSIFISPVCSSFPMFTLSESVACFSTDYAE